MAPDHDLDSAAHRHTVIESTPLGATPTPIAPNIGVKPDRPATEVDPSASRMAPTFEVRVLLPDGDRRTLDVSVQPVTLGSGLDDVGVTGDPRVGAGEAQLLVEPSADLFVVPQPGSQGVFRRLRGEETLADGDVILVGDIAARYTSLPPAPAVDGLVQVVGGSANSAVGRFTFLRRDGSDGPIHDLPAGKTIVGRTDGHLNFPNDGRLSRRHARLFSSERGVTIEDLGSRNGTYLRVRERTRLEPGDALRVGSAGLQIKSRR